MHCKHSNDNTFNLQRILYNIFCEISGMVLFRYVTPLIFIIARLTNPDLVFIIICK